MTKPRETVLFTSGAVPIALLEAKIALDASELRLPERDMQIIRLNNVTDKTLSPYRQVVGMEGSKVLTKQLPGNRKQRRKAVAMQRRK